MRWFFFYPHVFPYVFVRWVILLQFCPLDFGEVIFFTHKVAPLIFWGNILPQFFPLRFWWGDFLLTYFTLRFSEVNDFAHAFFALRFWWGVFLSHFFSSIFWGEVFCSNFSFRFWWSDFLYSQIFPLDFLRWFLCGELFYSHSFLYILLRQAWLLFHFIFQCFAEVTLHICQEVVLALLLLRLAKGYPPLFFGG